jgi:hypothetical protein
MQTDKEFLTHHLGTCRDYSVTREYLLALLAAHRREVAGDIYKRLEAGEQLVQIKHLIGYRQAKDAVYEKIKETAA